MKVEFPEFINRTRLFFIIESDLLIVFFSVMLLSLWIIGKIITMFFALVISLIIAYYVLKIYMIAKYEKAPGFIRHFFYNLGIFKIKLDEEKYPELKYRESKNFYPSGFVKEFRD